jgi:hypothetical protein
MAHALAGGSIERKESKSERKIKAVSPLTTLLLYPKPDRQGEVSLLNHYTKNFSLIHHDRVAGFEYIEFTAEASIGRLRQLITLMIPL